MSPRAARAIVATLALLATGALVVGCEAIVANDVPDFFCSGTDTSACPAGMVCDAASRRCVASGSSGGVEGGGDDGPIGDETTPPSDGGKDSPLTKDGDAGPAPVGSPCRVDADCAGKMCGDGTLLTPAIVATTGPVCTKPCCTSNDCPSGLVCFGPGTGGKYCVPAAQVSGRQPPSSGGAGAGAGCSKGSDCRSGLCTGSKCQDTCCAPTDCASPTTCRVGTLSGHDTWSCGTGGTGLSNDGCIDGTDCKSAACYQSRCRPACCGTKSCVDLGFPSGRCSVRLSGSDAVNLCLFNSSGAAFGQSCTADGDCKSDFCDPDTKTCSDVCCVDSDCAPYGGTSRCVATTKPADIAPRQLHCTKP